MNAVKWLIRREFWENKGGFFWAPVVAGGIFLLLNLAGLAVAMAAAGRAHIQIGLVKIDALMEKVDPEAIAMAAAGVDLTFALVAMAVSFVTAIVVFFYCLGAMYDERKDRSILFWKSLPLSDRDTTISKVVSAVVLAPSIGLLAGVATAFGMLLILTVFAAFNGQNVFGLLFWQAHPFKMAAIVLATLPVSALWALPSVGWLMLCSAWAKSKPFLWALGVPVGTGIMVSWFDLMQAIKQPDIWFWEHVVGRVLFSVVPGSWVDQASINFDRGFDSPVDALNVVTLGNLYSPLLSANLWIGAAAGIAMLVLAARLRRWRDEA